MIHGLLYLVMRKPINFHQWQPPWDCSVHLSRCIHSTRSLHRFCLPVTPVGQVHLVAYDAATQRLRRLPDDVLVPLQT